MGSKFIFITGGVLSSLGKGITSASLALILEAKGLKVALMKLDPYLNVDPGTMNPLQHGEVYVTDDGAETDLDLGHYFRFSASPLTRVSNTTSGQIYDEVLKKERRGEYLGKTVQVIPHITDEIKSRILLCANQEKDIDVTIVEIGGTVGDIESQPFMEAIRQFHNERKNQCINIHLTYVPYIEHAGEVKTKPTQHSVQKLQQSGIFPDMILCRAEVPLGDEIREKISLFCSVPTSRVIDVINVKDSIYEVPLYLQKAGLDLSISEILGLSKKPANLKKWKERVEKLISAKETITIALVGKYLQHQDAYKSILEALQHASIDNGVKVVIKCIESDKIVNKEEFANLVSGCNGVLVPGGFGQRGWEGKIIAAQYCRENRLPYFGICLGMQVMCVEFARHVLHMPQANSTEIDAVTPTSIISLLSEQRKLKNLGGTMRLGAYPCKISEKSHVYEAYGKREIFERHRHRYEFNNEYLDACQAKGLRVVGTLSGGELCEIVEIENHPWMVGVQFHPEFKSKLMEPHPLFSAFIKASIGKPKEKKNDKMEKKRLIGIDYGMKRTGLAISDPFRSFAIPIGRIDNLKNPKETIKTLLQVIKDKGEVESFVVGLPLLLNGQESDMSKRVREFASVLESETNIKVTLLDERLTSKAAESLLREQNMNRKKRAQEVDTLSASLILQTHLSLQ